MKRARKPIPKEVLKALKIVEKYFGHRPFDIEWIYTMQAIAKLENEAGKRLL